MNAIPFDTLKLARSLEAAGLPTAVAGGASEALAEAIGGVRRGDAADGTRLTA